MIHRGSVEIVLVPTKDQQDKYSYPNHNPLVTKRPSTLTPEPNTQNAAWLFGSLIVCGCLVVGVKTGFGIRL